MRGRGKGSQFERDLSRKLSQWWSNWKRDDIFWRTSQSGGRAKTRMKTGQKTFGQYGDIHAVDPIGQPLMDLVTIEAKKGYNKESAFNAMDKIPVGGMTHPCQWEKFLEQVRTDSKNAGTPYWMLVHRRDHRDIMVFIPLGLCEALGRLRQAQPSMLITTQEGLQVFATTFDEFIECADPEEIRWMLPAKKITIRTRR